MMKLSNIFLLLNFFIFGLNPHTHVLLAQNNEAGTKAEHQLSKIIDYYRSGNTDTAFILMQNLLEFAKAENLNDYEAQAKTYIGRYYMDKGSTDSSLHYFNDAGTIFNEIKDTLNLAKVFFFKSLIYKSIGENDSLFKYQLKANDLFTIAGDTVWFSISNNYLGNNYSHEGNYILALKHLQKSLEAAKLLGNKQNIGANYNAIGTVYRKTNDKEKEEEAYLNAIETLENIDKSIALGQAYNNLSELYFDKGETEKAFETLEKAKTLFEDIGYPLGLCSYYSVLGYHYSTTDPTDNLKVIECFNKSISIAKEYGDIRQYADGTSYLGTAYMEIGELQKAKTILKKGMKAAEEKGLNPEILKITGILAEVYSKSNQPKTAYHLLQKHLALKDSLSGEDKIKEFTQLDMQYKFRQQQISDSLRNVQKELEKDFQHKKELRDQQRTKSIFISISILVILIAIFIFANSRKKKKQVKVLNEKNLKINDQKNEIEESAKKVDEAYAKLKDLDEYKQSMTNMLVHDLKNPLNLLVNLDAIEAENDKNIIINRTSHQMLNLVKNLLDINKAEDNVMELDKVELTLFEVFDSAVEETMFLSKQKNIQIINKSRCDYRLNVDREILTRVFINLLTNAIKFSPANNDIVFTAELTKGNLLRVSVKDNGKGIPQEYQQAIFEKFKQVEHIKSGKIKSTGLGLAFCKLAIESHGWEIGVDSEEGKGAEFWIKVKAYQPI